MEQVLQNLTLEFFGTGQHAINPEPFLALEGAIFLDVRTREEIESVAIGLHRHQNIISVNIPVHELPARISELPKDKQIGIFCPANVRSGIVYLYLLSHGFSTSRVRVILGGYTALTDALKPGQILKLIQEN